MIVAIVLIVMGFMALSVLVRLYTFFRKSNPIKGALRRTGWAAWLLVAAFMVAVTIRHPEDLSLSLAFTGAAAAAVIVADLGLQLLNSVYRWFFNGNSNSREQ